MPFHAGGQVRKLSRGGCNGSVHLKMVFRLIAGRSISIYKGRDCNRKPFLRMTKIRSRFFYVLVAMAAVLMSVSLWFSYASPPQFDGPEMAFQKGLSRSKNPGCIRPGQKTGISYPMLAPNCKFTQPVLREIFNPAEAVSHAVADLRGGAFRFIGRTHGSQSGIVIPGFECATAKLQNSLHGSACLILMPPWCKGKDLAELDTYARTYNMTAIGKSDQSSSTCK